MPVRAIDPEDRRERKWFVALEHGLLGGEPLFVREFDSDMHKRLRGRSPFLRGDDRAFFVASNGRYVARCAALVNRRWQRDKGDQAGFIGHFAAAQGRAPR
jgi:hypothetical protein